MHERLDEELEKAGQHLRASHDDAVIADVIGAVEDLDDENSQITAELLRKMVATTE